jgi:hypothetical protein
MDKIIYERLINDLSPFDGKMISTDLYIPINDLRRAALLIFQSLNDNNLLADIYKVDDWLEHDNYLPDKKLTFLSQILDSLRDDQTFFNIRHGDTNVYTGYYDSLDRWYIRIYVSDHRRLHHDKINCGSLNICIGSQINILQEIGEKINSITQIKIIETTSSNLKKIALNYNY